jgi:hypothetical protein
MIDFYTFINLFVRYLFCFVILCIRIRGLLILWLSNCYVFGGRLVIFIGIGVKEMYGC